MDYIKKSGKKLANLPDAKRINTIAQIQEHAKKIAYDELSELFNTSVKKVGTRLAVLECLKVLIAMDKVKRTAPEVLQYIEEMKTSGNELLENSVKEL